MELINFLIVVIFFMKISKTDSLQEDNDKKYTNCHLDNNGFSTKHKFHSIDKSESIVINLKDPAVLHGIPGREQTIDVLIKNTAAIGIPDAQLLVSSGEEFPSGNSNDGSRGGAPAAIQLIQKMEPSGYLTLASNSTLISTLHLRIPSYIKVPSSSRISISVQKQAYDINSLIKNPKTMINEKAVIPQDMETTTRSFYFNIYKEEIFDPDLSPPECRRSLLCNDRQTICGKSIHEHSNEYNGVCSSKKWHSVISVKDETSGLKSINVTSPGSHLIHKLTNEVIQYPINIGSKNIVDVWIETSCCYDGVEITVRDLMGQSTKCIAGINPNNSPCAHCSNLVLLLSSIYIVKYLKYWILNLDI